MNNIKFKTKISLDSYIRFTSVMMIFLQGLVITGLSIIDIKFYYLFLISNILLLILKNKIKINKNFILIFMFLFIHGFINFYIFKINYIYLIKQLIGISISAIYFYNVFRLYDFKKIFNIYLKLAVFFTVVAIVFYPTGYLDKEAFRMDGLMSEPSKFVAVMTPALFYFLKNKKIKQALILFLGFIFAQSSLGYIAIILMVLFLIFRKETLKYVGLTIIPLFFLIALLKQNELFQSRYESTMENFEVFKTSKFSENTNLSVYVLLKNAYISVNNFKDHPFGTGLGSFATQHDYYIQELKLPSFVYIIKMEDLNREDANSLFFRIISDLGMFGLISITIFLFFGFSSHFKNYDRNKKSICIGVFIYFLIKLLRMGHYFSEETFLFLFLFLYSLPNLRNSKKLKTNE